MQTEGDEFIPHHYMEVEKKFHAPVSLSPAKKSPRNPVDYTAACVNTTANLYVVVKIKCY
jgi:DNA polymerase IIIc chi subunit